MKTIGLIGGITWHSTADYYRQINAMVQHQLGGVHSAEILIRSVDFDRIKALTFANDWNGLAHEMIQAAQALQKGGAGCILICANTMHNIAPAVQDAIQIPLIHIGKATALAVLEKGIKKVALLGTKYTMQMDFYTAQLKALGIETIIPSADDIAYINHAIYEEFGCGIFLPETKTGFLQIIEQLVKDGAEGVILGCTEIPILIQQKDCSVPVFDTTLIHVSAAVEFALS
ncbi:MAG: aspartate/glutamate racemase family protein [Bacteroidetes bacterium]|nr:aspartate/glutamate racemase family protein [Bacteroidota bacterium]